MSAPDLLRLAWRGLSRRPTRSLLTALGLAVALAGMVVFLSLGEGLRQVFTAQFRSVGPDIQVSLDGSARGLLPPPTLDGAGVRDIRALALSLGATQVTPVVTRIRQSLDPAQSAVFYGLPAGQGIGALFTGVRAGQGRLFVAADEGRAVAALGARAAKNAGVVVGDSVDILGTPVQVVGVLEGGQGLTDTFTFLPLTTLQRAAGVPGRVSLVALTLRDPAQAPAVAARIGRQLRLDAQTRGDVLALVGRVLRITDVARFGLSLVALIVGGLAVANTVAMGVFERTREFGTLRATRARPAFVRALVVTESLLLSMLAGVLGLLAGLVGIAGINVYTRGLAGIDAAALTGRLALLALGVSVVMGLLAGLIPARQAGRVPITEALGQA